MSQRVNQYLNDKAPWKSITIDREAAATAVYVSLQAIDWLKVLWAPILPHSSEQLHAMLGYVEPFFGRQYTTIVDDARGSHLALRYDHSTATGRWAATVLPAGQQLQAPTALFIKLDETAMAEKG